jgi:hypothetical protein
MTDESLSKFIDEEGNSPVFYKPQEVVWLHTWLNRAAIAVVVISIISGFAGFPAVYHASLPIGQSSANWNIEALTVASISVIFGVIFQSTFGYFTLKAFGSVLKLLMEMEYNARAAK